jgi:hypothetical protein
LKRSTGPILLKGDNMDDNMTNRQFTKSDLKNIDMKGAADIAHGIPQPAIEKSYDENALKIKLPEIKSNPMFKKFSP